MEHEERVERLRELAEKDKTIAVPRYLFEKALSRGRTKAGTAAGDDGITWITLAALRSRARHDLCKPFEQRVNGVDSDVGPIKSWTHIVIRPIDKKLSPVTSADFRPIAWCSVLQKVYVSIVMKLIEAFSDEVSPVHFGFREGHQTEEVCEVVRSVLDKGTRGANSGLLLSVTSKEPLTILPTESSTRRWPKPVPLMFRDTRLPRNF